jgi:ribokinase
VQVLARVADRTVQTGSRPGAAEKDIDLLVIGDCGIDLVLLGEDVAVEFGQVERLVDEARLALGGSAAITAAGAARLEMRTVLASTVGDDLFGSFATNELLARGVDLRGLKVRQGHSTGVTVHLSCGDDRAILTALGSIPTLRPDDLADEWLSRARHVHVSSYFLLDELRAHLPHLFRRAHSVPPVSPECPGRR